MHAYQAFIIAILLYKVLSTRKNTEVLCIVAIHVISVAIYYCVSFENYNYYYTVMCLVFLSSGMLLRPRFKVAAVCSYCLVFVCAIGYFLWYKDYPHTLYDAICAIILIIQFASTIPRMIFNGADTTVNRHFMDGSSRFDGNKEYDTMHKTPKTQED